MKFWIPDIRHPKANLLKRQFFKVPGTFAGIVAPSGAKFLRAIALGCGGNGDNWGGGGLYARSRRPTQPGWVYSVQVGNTSTSSAIGDSAVWKGSAGTGEVIVYADRGRGSGQGGKAVNSVGDIRREGENGHDADGKGGLPGGDAADLLALGFIGRAGTISSPANTGSPGAGGRVWPIYDSLGNFRGYTSGWCGGLGKVCLEWFDADPGF